MANVKLHVYNYPTEGDIMPVYAFRNTRQMERGYLKPQSRVPVVPHILPLFLDMSPIFLLK